MVDFILDNRMIHQNFRREAPPKQIWFLHLWLHSQLIVNLGTFVNLCFSVYSWIGLEEEEHLFHGVIKKNKLISTYKVLTLASVCCSNQKSFGILAEPLILELDCLDLNELQESVANPSAGQGFHA